MQKHALAEKAGLAVGDAIVSVNQQRFSSLEEFVAICRTNVNVELQYIRVPEAPVVDAYKEVELFFPLYLKFSVCFIPLTAYRVCCCYCSP